MASGIIKGWATNSLKVSLRTGVSVGCVDTNVSGGCSTTTREQRERPIFRLRPEMGHYALKNTS